MRDECPLFYAQQLGYVVITEMADILDVFNQPDVYSSEIVQDPVFPLGEQTKAVLAAPDFRARRCSGSSGSPRTTTSG